MAVEVSDGFVRIAHASADASEQNIRALLAALGPDDLAGIILFCSSHAELDRIAEEARTLRPDITVIGCTTAGEITPSGARKNSITAIGFPRADFAMEAIRFDDLPNFRPRSALYKTKTMKAEAAARAAHLGEHLDWAALLLIDGMSCRSELVAHTMRHVLEDVPLIGGSAGDDMKFERTSILHEGAFRQNCAVLTIFVSRRPLRVFHASHHRAGEELAVVSEADVVSRTVFELNGRPAAIEYARLAGDCGAALSDTIFARNPLMVRVGGEYYARGVMRANPDDSLSFHSAIEQGLVLRLGKSTQAVDRLTEALGECGEPLDDLDMVLALESAQNRIEADAEGTAPLFDALYGRHRFAGFHTYGEQFRDVHLNRSLSGLAIGRRILG